MVAMSVNTAMASAELQTQFWEGSKGRTIQPLLTVSMRMVFMAPTTRPSPAAEDTICADLLSASRKAVVCVLGGRAGKVSFLVLSRQEMFDWAQATFDFLVVEAHIHHWTNLGGFLGGEQSSDMICASALFESVLLPLAGCYIAHPVKRDQGLLSAFLDGIASNGSVPHGPAEVGFDSFVTAIDGEDQTATGWQAPSEAWMNAFSGQSAVEEQGGLLGFGHVVGFSAVFSITHRRTIFHRSSGVLCRPQSSLMKATS